MDSLRRRRTTECVSRAMTLSKAVVEAPWLEIDLREAKRAGDPVARGPWMVSQCKAFAGV